MQKYSIVIPTMWKSPRTKPMIDWLLVEDSVDEIILIDNTEGRKIEEHPKIHHIVEGKNTGVNAAWNKGVELARNELVCLVSDDITFNPAIFQVITEELLEEYGFIGQATPNFTYSVDEPQNPYIVDAHGPEDKGGWGTLIFFRKQDWIPIPEELMVWYGDNWMRDINPVKTGVLGGFRVETEMSTTVDLPEFDKIKEQDGVIWRSNFSRWKQQFDK